MKAKATCEAPGQVEGEPCGREAAYKTPYPICASHYRQIEKHGVAKKLTLHQDGPLKGKTCTGPGTDGPCGRPAQCHTPFPCCNTHNRQFMRDGKMRVIRPVKPKHPPTARDEHGNKLCRACEEWLSPALFSPNPKSSDGLRSHCKPCFNAFAVARRFGITRQVYEELAAAQGNACWICKTPATDKQMSIDHDHDCCPGDYTCGDCIRGVICNTCNLGLGYFRNSPELLLAAVEYLTQGTNILDFVKLQEVASP